MRALCHLPYPLHIVPCLAFHKCLLIVNVGQEKVCSVDNINNWSNEIDAEFCYATYCPIPPQGQMHLVCPQGEMCFGKCWTSWLCGPKKVMYLVCFKKTNIFTGNGLSVIGYP